MTTATEHDTLAGRQHDGRQGTYSNGAEMGGRGAGMPRDPGRASLGLGWFSIGLGLAEVAMPRRMARIIGVEDDDTNRNILLAYGLREIATGVALLAGDRRRREAVWARVGGDVMDLAFLGHALTSEDSQRGRVATAAAAVLGVTALDVLTGQRLNRQRAGEPTRRGARKGIRVSKAVTIGRSPEEVYRFWRNFTNLPRFMEHLEAVEIIDDRRSRWRARAPAGTSVEWEAELVQDRPNELISWRSVEHAEVPNTGTVRFRPAPGDRGTEVHVDLRYDPPAGRLGSLVAKLFGEEPSQQVDGDLRRLKQVLETGEVTQSDASVFRGPHPAQPSDATSTTSPRRAEP